MENVAIFWAIFIFVSGKFLVQARQTMKVRQSGTMGPYHEYILHSISLIPPKNENSFPSLFFVAPLLMQLTRSNTQQVALANNTPQIKRTSSLSDPILNLTGHSAEILTCRFSNSGEYIVSGDFNNDICNNLITLVFVIELML